MPTDARRTLGQIGEDLAAAHLERLGFEILARNFRTRLGELDLVAFDGKVLVFCEVKTRRAGSGHPWDSLGPVKQAKVRRMAVIWLTAQRDRPYYPALRFDAIGVVLDRTGALVSLDHEQAAF